MFFSLNVVLNLPNFLLTLISHLIPLCLGNTFGMISVLSILLRLQAVHRVLERDVCLAGVRWGVLQLSAVSAWFTVWFEPSLSL